MNRTERRVADITCDIHAFGQTADGKLWRVPAELAAELERHLNDMPKQDPYLFARLESHRPAFLTSAVTVHFWALRSLIAVQRQPRSRERLRNISRLLDLATALPTLIFNSNALSRASKTGKRLLHALIQGDAFACYAAVFSGMRAAALSAELAQSAPAFSLIFTTVCQCVRRTVRTLVNNNECFYTEFVDVEEYGQVLQALATTSVLEHAAAALTRLHQFACASAAAQNEFATGMVGEIANQSNNVAAVLNDLVQPFMGLHPGGLSKWPRQAPADGGLLALLPQLQAVLSGTCVQYWLGWDLILQRLSYTNGKGATHGLSPSLRPPPAFLHTGRGNGKEQAAARLLRQLEASTLAWMVTFHGMEPPCDPTSIPSPSASAAAALPDSIPYKAVQVYELIHETVSCLLQEEDVIVVGSLDGFRALVQAACLLQQLFVGLRPRQSSVRIEPLWFILARLLGHKTLFKADFTTQTSFLCGLSSLLSALPDDQPLTSQPSVVPSAATGYQAGVRIVSSAKVGLMEALEVQIRDHCTSPEKALCCVAVIHHVLLRSAVWPVALAYGGRGALPLAITLRKAVVHLLRSGGGNTIIAHADVRTAYRDSLLPDFPVGRVLRSAMQTLLWQSLAAVLPDWAWPDMAVPTAGGPRTVALEGMSRNQIRLLGGVVPPETPPSLVQQALVVYTMSDWLPSMVEILVADPLKDVAASLVTLRVLLAAALQCLRAYQQLMSGLAPQMPQMLRHMPWPVQVQGSAASGAGSGGGGAGGGSSNGGRDATHAVPLGRQHDGDVYDGDAADVLASWTKLLMEDIPFSPFQLATQPGIAKHPDLLSTALDVLEVAAAVFPHELARELQTAGGSGAAGTSNTGTSNTGSSSSSRSSSRAATSSSNEPSGQPQGKGTGGGFALDEALLMCSDRAGLLATLRCLVSSPIEVRMVDKSAGCSAGLGAALIAGPEDVVSSTIASIKSLAEDVIAKHRLSELPALLSPQQVRFVIAAVSGFQPCDNPRCANLAGLRESDLPSLRCARCSRVWYCSRECQAAHWGAGHKRVCKAGAGGTTGGKHK